LLAFDGVTERTAQTEIVEPALQQIILSAGLNGGSRVVLVVALGQHDDRNVGSGFVQYANAIGGMRVRYGRVQEDRVVPALRGHRPRVGEARGDARFAFGLAPAKILANERRIGGIRFDD
jgi:hypothetical protein